MSAAAHLVDTSVLVRLLSEDDERHSQLLGAASEIAGHGGTLAFTPQVARESWSVLTRPRAANGFGLLPGEALSLVKAAHAGLTFLPDTPDIYGIWLNLVATHTVSGKQVHDA